MDERLKSIWITEYPPKAIKDYLIQYEILTYPLNIHQEEE